MRVFVYYNLHRKLWSVKALEGENKGRVIAHRKEVVLREPKPKVSEAGRQRVIREKKKNVHAGLSGYYIERVPVPAISFDVTYNPYKYDSFVDTEDHEAQEWSEYAHLTCGDGWRNIEAIFSREYFQEKVKVSA